MADIKLEVISTTTWAGTGDGNQVPVANYSRVYLAQGDSWFSLGAVPPWSTTNVLEGIWLEDRRLAVDCGYPGRTLAHMVDRVTDPTFDQLLAGKLAWPWDGLLMSGGGNDLIDALGVEPHYAPEVRLLRRQDEWGSGSSASRYVCEEGWTTFRGHMLAVLDVLLARRDASRNPAMPVYLHTYDQVTPRFAPAGAGKGPWLAPALKAYGIPPDDWNAVADELIERLRQLWLGAAGPARNVHVIDTVGTLRRADPGTKGNSNDWENEIHPNKHGYGLLGEKWREVLDP